MGLNFRFERHFISFIICKGKENISCYEFGRRLSLRQMTCWTFKTKIEPARYTIDTLSEKERNPIEIIPTS